MFEFQFDKNSSKKKTDPGQSRLGVNDRFLSYSTRLICVVLRPETTVHVTFFDDYGGRNHCPGDVVIRRFVVV